MRGRPPIGTRPQTRPNVKCMSPQTDSSFRASHLQRVSGYADNLSDLVWALSPVYEVADLLHSFWRKLYWSSAPYRLRFQLHGLEHSLLSPCLPAAQFLVLIRSWLRRLIENVAQPCRRQSNARFPRCPHVN